MVWTAVWARSEAEYSRIPQNRDRLKSFQSIVFEDSANHNRTVSPKHCIQDFSQQALTFAKEDHCVFFSGSGSDDPTRRFRHWNTQSQGVLVGIFDAQVGLFLFFNARVQKGVTNIVCFLGFSS